MITLCTGPNQDLFEGSEHLSRDPNVPAKEALQILVDLFVKNQDTPTTYFTHDDLVLNALRLAVGRDLIPPSKVALFYKPSPNEIDILQIDRFGRLNSWPRGFLDIWDDVLDELLGFPGKSTNKEKA